MKKAVKFFGIAFITIFCFLADGIPTSDPPSHSLNSTSLHLNSNDTDENKQYIAIPVSFNAYALQAEILTGPFNTPSSFSFKNSSSGYALLLKCSKQLFAVTFKQYITFSANLLIRDRKSDLIFPFHYFW